MGRIAAHRCVRALGIAPPDRTPKSEDPGSSDRAGARTPTHTFMKLCRFTPQRPIADPRGRRKAPPARRTAHTVHSRCFRGRLRASRNTPQSRNRVMNRVAARHRQEAEEASPWPRRRHGTSTFLSRCRDRTSNFARLNALWPFKFQSLQRGPSPARAAPVGRGSFAALKPTAKGGARAGSVRFSFARSMRASAVVANARAGFSLSRVVNGRLSVVADARAPQRWARRDRSGSYRVVRTVGLTAI